MHILFVIDSLVSGGAERQLVELIKGLAKRSDYKISLGVLENIETGYTDTIRKLQIDIHLFPRKFRYDFSPILSIRQFIIRQEVHLVHSFLDLGALYGLIAGLLAGRPVVCSSIRNAKDEHIKNAIIIQIEARISDILVANSLTGFTNRFKAMRPNFRLIYNGIDFDRFNVSLEDVEAVRKHFGLQRYKHIIGMVATFSRYKDYDTWCSSFLLWLPIQLCVRNALKGVSHE